MKRFRERCAVPLLICLILVAEGFAWQSASQGPKQSADKQPVSKQQPGNPPKSQSKKQAADAPPADQPRPDEHVIMISIDGLVPEYYTTPTQIGLRVPHLVEMRLNGAYADGVEGVYPSVTYPAHTTLVTGVRPSLHSIVQNRIFEAPTEAQTGEWFWFSKTITSETLWAMAKRNGLVTASVGWPVTVGADIDYNVPEIFDPKENPPTGKRALQYSTPGLLAKAFAGGVNESGTDGRRTAVSEYIINAYKPNLMLIHLVELDDTHHKHGPRSAEALETTEREDGYIGRIVESVRKAGILDKTTFFLVSDHGFAPVERRFEPNVVLVKHKLITLDASGAATDWKAAAWPAGGSCAIVLRDPNDKALGTEVAAIFDKIAAREKSPINRIVKEAEIKRLEAIPTAFLMLDAAPSYSFGDELKGPEVHETKDYRGTHGHLPSRVEMRSSLIIYGEAARVGAKIPLAQMIDIAPTAAGLLGLIFPNAEGAPITELLKPGAALLPPSKKKPKKNRDDARPKDDAKPKGDAKPLGRAQK